MDDIFPAAGGTATPQCLTNTLSINVFLLPDNNIKHNDEDEREDVQRLARLARDLNRYFQSLDYPWWSSLMPPEFGLYRIMTDDEKNTNGTVCLRALCRYGPCVADEWRAIRAVLDFTATTTTTTIEKDDHKNILVECWDEDDGPVLLIQAADDLPTVLAEHSHTGGRYRSWIYRGQVYFLLALPDQELSLSQAWSLLLAEEQNKGLTVAAAAVQSIIATASPGRHGDADQWHRTAVVVPTDLAVLCTNHPRLIHAAIEVEASSSAQQRPSLRPPRRPPVESSKWSSSNHADGRPQQQQLVWLPIRMGRTSYAVLRSMAEVVSNDDDVSPGPTIHAAMGQVLARGIATLHNDRRNTTTAATAAAGIETTTVDGPAKQWDKLLRRQRRSVRCHRDGPPGNDQDRMLDNDDDDVVLASCPIFDDDMDHQSAAASGGTTSRWSRAIWENDDVDDETTTNGDDDAMTLLFQPYDATSSHVPLEKFVIDSDAWMDVVTSRDETTAAQKDKEDGINAVHKGLTSFLTGDSSAAGVVGRSSSIHGGRALRILHAALHASSAEELAERLDTEFDPFFSKNDYDDLGAAGDDDGTEEEGEDTSLRGLMRAMDGELGRSTHDGSPMQVMTNLLKSLGSGGPGPTRHLLNEMNQTAPNVILDDQFD